MGDVIHQKRENQATGTFASWSRERIAVAAHFAILGLVGGAWMSSIDDMKDILGLNAEQLGWILFAGPVGSLVGLTCANALIARLGSRRSLVATAGLYLAAALVLAGCFLLRAPTPLWLASIAVFCGSCTVMNIAVNTQCGIVERKTGRMITNSLHAMWSMAFLAAGFLALLAAYVGLSPGWRILGVFAASSVAFLVFVPWLPREDDARKKVEKGKGFGLRRLDAAFVFLGVAALVILGSEGAIYNWINVFYRESLQATAGRVKWGFCVVCVTVTIGRLVTDRFVNRFGSVRILRIHSVLVAAGLGVMILSPYTGLSGLRLILLATAGCAVAGYGISALAPILYSKANRSRSMPAATAVTFVNTMGFLICFVSPPLVGHIANATSLSAALGIFAVAMLGCLFIPLSDD